MHTVATGVHTHTSACCHCCNDLKCIKHRRVCCSYDINLSNDVDDDDDGDDERRDLEGAKQDRARWPNSAFVRECALASCIGVARRQTRLLHILIVCVQLMSMQLVCRL